MYSGRMSVSAASNTAEHAPSDLIGLVPSNDPRSAGRIRIERLILHGLDNRTSQIRLVDAPAVLTAETERFFAQHIEFAIQRADWLARFADPGSAVPALCAELFGTVPSFVQASRSLASRLFGAMRSRAITPGDFVIAVYTDATSVGPRVAMLKLDLDHRLLRTFGRVGNQHRVRIEAAENLLPDSTKLQKGALLTRDASGSFALALLDTQAGPRSEGIAAYFYRTFLQATISPSPRRTAREFVRASDIWLSRNAYRLSIQELLHVYHARRDTLASETLSLDSFARAALPDTDDLRANVMRALTEAFVQAGLPSFQPDQLLRIVPAPQCAGGPRVTLELDGGVRISGPLAMVESVVHFDHRRTPDNKIRMVIESLTLREVSER